MPVLIILSLIQCVGFRSISVFWFKLDPVKRLPDPVPAWYGQLLGSEENAVVKPFKQLSVTHFVTWHALPPNHSTPPWPRDPPSMSQPHYEYTTRGPWVGFQATKAEHVQGAVCAQTSKVAELRHVTTVPAEWRQFNNEFTYSPVSWDQSSWSSALRSSDSYLIFC